MQELEEAIVMAEAQGIQNDVPIIVRTAWAEWELIFKTEVKSGQIQKLYHALFVPL